MAIAENRACTDAVRAALAAHSPPAPGRELRIGYDDMTGSDHLRSAIAGMVVDTFLARVPRHAIEPSRLVVASGCGALLMHLSALLCNPGDVVLLPTPTYAALYNDLQLYAGAVVVDVPTEEAGLLVTVAALERARAAAAARGQTVRAALILHPSNPVGNWVEADDLSGIVAWAAAAGLHLIVDEIYANSIHSPPAVAAGDAGVLVTANRTPFTSVVDLCWQAAAAHGGRDPVGDWMPHHVHVLWGMSKDWGMSGLRVGALFTHHAELRAALSNAGYFTTVSNDTQRVLAELLTDRAASAALLSRLQHALREGAELVCDTLTRLGLPFVRPAAGMYVWADLSSLLPPAAPAPASEADGGSSEWAREEALTAALWERHRLLFTPGAACHAARGGWYRICYAFHCPAGQAEGMRRLTAFVRESRAGQEGR
jgi:aspartate/methionine/tyrosine aminotransferase